MLGPAESASAPEQAQQPARRTRIGGAEPRSGSSPSARIFAPARWAACWACGGALPTAQTRNGVEGFRSRRPGPRSAQARESVTAVVSLPLTTDRRRGAATLGEPSSRRRDDVQVKDLRPRGDAGAARTHPGGDVLGRIRVVDQPQPDGSGACGTGLGGRLYDDDIGLVTYVQAGGHANRCLLPQSSRLRHVIQSGHLGTAAAAVPAHDDPTRRKAGRLRCLRFAGCLIDRCLGHAEPPSLRGDPPRYPSRRRPRESPGSRVKARPGLPTCLRQWPVGDPLADHSGGTAPDSHRLPRTAVAMSPAIIPSGCRPLPRASAGAYAVPDVELCERQGGFSACRPSGTAVQPSL